MSSSSASVDGIRDHRGDIVHVDTAAAARVKRKLAQLAARCGAVAAEERNEHRPRLGLERQFGLAHLGVDQPRQIALGVGIAGQRRGILGPLADRAQRRVAAQIAGFDHHAAFACRQRQHRLDRRRDVAAAGLGPDRAAAAEQRNGLCLLDQARRIGG